MHPGLPFIAYRTDQLAMPLHGLTLSQPMPAPYAGDSIRHNAESLSRSPARHFSVRSILGFAALCKSRHGTDVAQYHWRMQPYISRREPQAYLWIISTLLRYACIEFEDTIRRESRQSSFFSSIHSRWRLALIAQVRKPLSY